ncbi:hypothetical protein, partial [Arsenophonus endosymbiont of Bemisia tabaci]|uniref:hypothetical protein n=1 Tax=Arsenophonus endosymbiont of Bemisia tabaci TaxID=536059 RepID=UPI0015F4BF4B
MITFFKANCETIICLGSQIGLSILALHNLLRYGVFPAYLDEYDIAKRLNFDDIIYMSYSIDFRRKVIFTMEEEG